MPKNNSKMCEIQFQMFTFQSKSPKIQKSNANNAISNSEIGNSNQKLHNLI